MTAPGKLIAVEGIDGSGKRTQVELLTLTLKARGHSVYSTGFPQYDSWFGKLVAKFLEWIEHLEYGIYSLPRESLILYLRVPPQEAQRLVERKSARSYTSAQKDLLEASLRHLEDAAEMYDSLSRSVPWATIQCFDAAAKAIREPEEIATDVLAAVEGVLSSASATEER